MVCRGIPIDSDFVFLSTWHGHKQGSSPSKGSTFIRFPTIEWDLSRKLVSTARSFMKTTRAYDPSLAGRLTTPINILGLNAIFSLQKSPGKIAEGFGDFCHHIKMGDYGWAAISGVEVGTMIGDGIDSLVTINGCLNSLDKRVPYSPELGCLMLPLVINLTVVTIFLKVAEIFQTKRFIEELKRNSGIENRDNRGYQKKLARITSSRFAASHGNDQSSVLDYAQKKLTVGYVSLAANATALCAFKMLLNPVVPQVIPLAMLTGVSVTRIFTHIYDKHLGDGVGDVCSHSSGVNGCNDNACN